MVLASIASAATFEKLGQPCRGFNVLATRLVTDPAGREWFVLSNTNEATGVELIFIDPKANTGKSYRAPAGQGAWLLNQVSPDTLIVGTYYDGKLMVFDLKEMKFTKVIDFPGEEYFWNGAIGGDGRLYGGTYSHAKLGALDLRTLTLEDCGAPAPPNLYCRNVSAMPDGRLLCNFVTEKPVTKIYDPNNKQWSDAPERLKKVQRCTTWNGYLLSIGTWDGKESTGPIAFDGKTLTPIEPPPFPIPPSGKFGVDGQMTTNEVLWLRDDNSLYRVNKDSKSAEKVYEQNLKSGAITSIDRDGDLLGIRGQDYLFVKAGATEAELRPIPVEPGPRPMHFIRADDRGRIWGGPPFGQTIFSMDPVTKKFTNTSNVCNSGGEVYDVCFGDDGKVYAVAYVGGDVIVYDPDAPWDQLNDKNPRTLVHLTTKGYIRPTAGVRLRDGVLFSGWMAAYGKYGGAIAMTDPKTGKTDLIENPLGEQAITALDLDEKFLYAGTGLHGNGLPNKPSERPQFGMIDRQTKKVVFQQPLGIGEVSRILCDAKTKQIVVVAERAIQLFDPEKREFTDPHLPPVNDRAIEVPGDGTIWFASETSIVHYDLTTHESTTSEAPTTFDHLTRDKSGVVYVSAGADLYRMNP
jgi:streptogramin lyase